MNGRTNTTSVTEVIEGVQVPLEAPTNLVLTPLNARVDITWTDPVDKFAAPDGQTATNPWDNVATWSHTIIVRKANSAPTSPSDGELIYTETTRNQHQYTAYSDTNNVINNTVYYYAVYAITTMDAVSDPIVDSCKPIAGTPVFKQELELSVNNIEPDTVTAENSIAVKGYTLFRIVPRFTNNSYYGSLLSIDGSLTQRLDVANPMGRYQDSFSAHDSIEGYFAGGSYITTGTSHNVYSNTNMVVKFNENLTAQSAPSGLTYDRTEAGDATVFDQYIIFAGGMYHDGTTHTSSERSYRNYTDAYTKALTKTTIENIDSCGEVGAATTNNHALFAGGRSSTRLSTESNTVTAYNASLTKNQMVSTLSEARTYTVGVPFDNRAVFFGGRILSGDTQVGTSGNYSRYVDIYDNSLTKSNGTLYPVSNVGLNIAIKLGSYIIISDNRNDNSNDNPMRMYDYSLTNISYVQNSPSHHVYIAETLDRLAFVWHWDYAIDIYEAV